MIAKEALEFKADICDAFYRKQTHLGKKSKLSWLLIMKVEIFSFTMIDSFLF